MKSLFIIFVVSLAGTFSIATLVNREEQSAKAFYPEPKASITPDLESRAAEMVVGLYIKAAQDNNEKALLGYIADLDTLPHRQPQKDPELSREPNVEDERVGRRLLDIVDEVGHDLLSKDEPKYIRNLGLVVARFESKCSTPTKCRVRAFFERFENREIVHDYIVYQIDGIEWKIVSVLPAIVNGP